MAAAHTVREIVRDTIAAEGVTSPDLWAVTLRVAAELVLESAPVGDSIAHRVAAAAVARAALLGISIEEAARCIREDAPFDIVDLRPRSPRRRLEDTEADAPIEDRVWDAKRRDER